MRNALILLAVLSTACEPATGPDGISTDILEGIGPDNAMGDTTVPNTAPTREIVGDLSEGQAMDLGWAASNYCWPATENVNFDGNHVLETFTQPTGLDIYLRVVPDRDVDVSLYAIQDGSSSVPPDISGVFSCDAMSDQTNDSNPGQAEVLYMVNYVDFSLTVGVAGINGATSGGYTLQIWEVEGANFDTGL